MSDAETARTLARASSTDPGSGLGTTVQAAPFQCSTRVCCGPLPLLKEPTVQALQGESTATPLSSLPSAPGFGGCRPDQLWQVAAEAAAGMVPVTTPASISMTGSVLARRFTGHRDCIKVPSSFLSVYGAPPRHGRLR